MSLNEELKQHINDTEKLNLNKEQREFLQKIKKEVSTWPDADSAIEGILWSDRQGKKKKKAINERENK